MCCKDDGRGAGGGGIGRPPTLKLVVDNPVTTGQAPAAAQPGRAPTDATRTPWAWIVLLVVALLVLRAS